MDSLNGNTGFQIRFGEGQSYRIRVGVWHRFQQTLTRIVLPGGKNKPVSTHQNDNSPLNHVENGGKQACRAIIL